RARWRARSDAHEVGDHLPGRILPDYGPAAVLADLGHGARLGPCAPGSLGAYVRSARDPQLALSLGLSGRPEPLGPMACLGLALAARSGGVGQLARLVCAGADHPRLCTD